MNRLLTQRDVCNLLRITYPTLYRWLKDGRFPEPVNGRGRKLLWSPEVVEEWVNARSPVPISVPTKSEKQKAREFIERQKRAKDTLAKHGITRRDKS